MKRNKREQRSFLIIGAGAVGQVIGAHLLKAGHDVVFLARPKQQQRFREHGLPIVYPRRWKSIFVEEVQALDSLHTLDLTIERTVLLCIRSEQTEGVLEILRQLPESWLLVSFQAASGCFETLHAAFPQRGLLRGSPGFSAFFDGFVVRNAQSLFLHTLIGPIPPGPSPEAAQLAALFRDAGLRAQAATDVGREIDAVYAFVAPMLLGLEYHGFHIHAFLAHAPMFFQTHAAGLEALAAVQRPDQPLSTGARFLVRLPPRLLRPTLQFALLSPDSHLVRMWSQHAPKIRHQTLNVAKEALRKGRERGLPMKHLAKAIEMVEKLHTPRQS